MPHSWLGRRLAGFFRRLVLLGARPLIDGEAEGLKLRVHTRDNISERRFLFMPQFYDQHERAILTAHLRPGDTFVDIGANAGIYTLHAARLVGPSGRVLSIEPNPTVSRRLLSNAALNGFEGRITLEAGGVSASDGTFEIALDDRNLGASGLADANSVRTITARCSTLLSILQRHAIARIDALKIDIEGAEDTALVPFFQSAPRELWPRLIVIENSQGQWKLNLEREFAAAGYQRVLRVRMNSVWTRPLHV